MTRLDLRLFGPFEVSADDKPAAGFDSDKVRALLAYLAVEADRPHRREKLAGLLWPDYPDTSARTSLRRAIKNLRDVIGDRDVDPPYLEITRQTVRFNQASDSWLDVAEFLQRINSSPEGMTQTNNFEKAIDLYKGPFLEGFSVSDSNAFEEWALATRQSLQAEALRILDWLAGQSLEAGRPERALRYARREVEIDPYREESRRSVMEALAISGERAQALAQYEELKELLATELGVEPDRETTDLFKKIESGSYETREKVSLPSGTVTFLFADIEGSTKLLEQLGADQYSHLLVEQRRILRAAFDQFGGTEIDTQGDAFFASFPRTTEAASAAARIQRDLAENEWPEEVEVRLRMGLHTGEPWLIEEGYVGMDVHRAARIAHVGHGGQVLLSETTTPLVAGDLPEGVALKDLGRHRLKDMRRPEHIHQLAIAGLTDEFPPLSSLEVVAEPGVAGGEAGARPPREVGESPYRGLASFREEDAAFFFGREVFTEQLWQAVDRGSLVAVVLGSSGSGKSSAVFAGLLPRLREEGDWRILTLRPGTHPFHALATTLMPHLEPGLDETDALFAVQKLAEGLQAGEISLYHTIQRVLEQDNQTGNQTDLISEIEPVLQETNRLLLILDQFEELYTLCPDPQTRQAFTDELLAAVESGAGLRPNPVSIVVTLRADFMGQALANRPFADAMQDGSLLLGPMNRAELQTAVEKPAELQGAAFEPGLVARILDDVGAEPGNLPLLEFALTLLWEKMDQGWMTHGAYEEIGRVEGALARYADEFYDGLKPAEQEQARRIFIQLVQPGQGTEDTRRVARREDLVGADWGLVGLLADQRLVVTGVDEGGQETVEVVHEALIRGWGQLRGWMAADRAFRGWQEGLRVALRAWESSGLDEGALLRGAPLAQAEEWLESRGDEVGPEEKAYIRASAELQARRTAERERRRRLIIGGLAIGLVVAVLLSIFAIGQRQAALTSAANAQNVALIAGSQAALANNDTDTALALAWQAVALNPESASAQAQLSEVAYTPGTVRILAGNEADVNRVVASPDSKAVFGVGTDGAVILWDLETGQVLWEAQAFTTGELAESGGAIKVEGNDGAFSLDGEVVVASYDDRIMFWNTDTGQLVRRIDSSALDQKIGLSPNGEEFATIGKEADGHLIFWDLDSGETVREFDLGSNIEEIIYTLDGEDILLASQSGDLTLLEAQSGEVIYEVEANLGSSAGPLFHLALSPDGTRVAANFSDSGVLIWDLASGNLLHDFRYESGSLGVAYHPLDGTMLISSEGIQTINPETGEVLQSNTSQSSAIFHLTITPDGKYAITTALDSTVRLWDLQDGQVIRQYHTPHALLFEVALSPDGQMLLVGSTDGSATLINVETGEEIRSLVDDQPIMSVTFSPDGRQALIGAGYRLAEKIESGHIILWDVETGEEIRRFEGHPYVVFNVKFSPDGEMAASAGNGAIVILWDIETGEEIRRFEDFWEDHIYPDNSFWNIAFSPDGQQLFALHSSGPIIVWDIESGEQIRQLDGHQGGGSVIFRDDGREMVSASVDSQVVLWDVQKGEILYRFSTHAGGMGKLSLSPDGTLLLGGSADGNGSLWSVDTGQEIRRYSGGFVFSPNFTPDGRNAVVGLRDGAVELWRIDLTLDELLTWVQANRYIPELTCEQRELYGIAPLCEIEP